MLKEESKESVTVTLGRACDTCRSASCTLYCAADSAYLCNNCDARVHAANPVASRHQRVRICQSCESSPASFLCKADSASLCTACDSEIHSSNPLAKDEDEYDDQEVASWLLLNQGNNNSDQTNEFLFGVEYLDLMDYSSSMDNQFEDHYSQSYGYSSEAHINVVPESITSDITVQYPMSDPLTQQLTPMDREARVLRYREKKKTRKFAKTIRYASRKAYAEIRPRIKGRFAKRTEADAEQLFTTTSDTGYGIVPSF